MRSTQRIASALVLGLLGLASIAPAARAQALIGGNGFQNGFAINGLNNGFGGFNNGFGGFNNGFGGFNNAIAFNGFGPIAAVGGGGFGPMGLNNGGVAAFGFGGPGVFYGSGVGFGAGYYNPYVWTPPQAYNNLGGVAAVIDQQVIRRPGQPLPAVRRRRR
jgi:hypothetical protein